MGFTPSKAACVVPELELQETTMTTFFLIAAISALVVLIGIEWQHQRLARDLRDRLAPTTHGHRAGAVYIEVDEMAAALPPDAVTGEVTDHRAEPVTIDVDGGPGRPPVSLEVAGPPPYTRGTFDIDDPPVTTKAMAAYNASPSPYTRGTFDIEDEPPTKEVSNADPDDSLSESQPPPPSSTQTTPPPRPSSSATPPEPAHKEPIGSSLVKAAANSEEEAKSYLDRGIPDAKPLRDGRMLHMVVLEPDRYDKHVIVSEAEPKARKLIKLAVLDRTKFSRENPVWDGKRTTKDGKAAWATLVEAYPHVKDPKDTLKSADANAILAVADAHVGKHGVPKWVEVIEPGEAHWHKAILAALKRHPVAREYLFDGEGKNELELDWVHPRTGNLCRTRTDRLIPMRDGHCVIDLKFMSEVSPGKFSVDTAKYGYDTQMAFTADGAGRCADAYKIVEVMVIAVRKSAPYLVAPYRFTEEKVLCHGREKYETGLDNLEALARHRSMPAPAYPEPIDINLPSYAQMDDDDEDVRDTMKELFDA